VGAFFSKSGFIPNRPAQNATDPKARHVEWHNAVTNGKTTTTKNLARGGSIEGFV